MAATTAGPKIIARGTYTPSADVVQIDIDTGCVGWKHFLIVARALPYSEPYSRCFGSMYVNMDSNYALFVFGPSSDNNIPNSGNYSAYGAFYSVDGSVIKKRGIASQTGMLKADIAYDWFCWQ